MHSFEHLTAETVSDIPVLLQGHSDRKIIAGGTDLLVLMKEGTARPTMLLDIKHIDELRGVEDHDGGLRIGSLTTLSDLAVHPVVRERFRVLAQAAESAASPQLRNMATIGGNLLQRPRCWYFRGDFPCWLKGGSRCFAVDGENNHHAIFSMGPCVAVNPSDIAPALLALDATINIEGRDGGRGVAAQDFWRAPSDDDRSETVLREYELVTSVDLPLPADNRRSVYLKVMERQTWGFALVSVAASIVLESGTVTDTQLVLGGVANTPWRVIAAEQAVRGRPLDTEIAAQAAALVIEGARPLRDNGYKVPLAANLVRRALESLV